jgi:hypothetical protein
MDHERRALVRRLGGLMLVGMMGSGARAVGMSRQSQGLPVEGELPSLAGASAWLNSAPLTGAKLRGKVVLVDFWTYSCINWRGSLPYVRARAEKYCPEGLVVIGAHAPEFQFETVIDNVRRAAQDMNVGYPIAIDNQYQLWNSFQNEYWPPCISSMRAGESGITTSARGITRKASATSSPCSRRRAPRR